MSRLWRLEAVAITSTVAAFILTALLVPTGPATESNAVAKVLLGTLGWTGAGILAIAVEGAIFAGYRRVHEQGYPRAAVAGGGLLAVIGVGDLLLNLRLLADLGLPALKAVRWERYGRVIGTVALAGGAVLAQRQLRRVGRELLSVGRGVASRLSKANVAPVLVAFLLVTTAFSTASLTSTASAQSDTIGDNIYFALQGTAAGSGAVSTGSATIEWESSISDSPSDIARTVNGNNADLVLIPDGTSLTAQYARNGSQAWSAPISTNSLTTGINGDIFGTTSDGVFRVDAVTGQQDWQTTIGSSSEVFYDFDTDTVVSYSGNSGNITYLDPKTGSITAEFSASGLDGFDTLFGKANEELYWMDRSDDDVWSLDVSSRSLTREFAASAASTGIIYENSIVIEDYNGNIKKYSLSGTEEATIFTKPNSFAIEGGELYTTNGSDSGSLLRVKSDFSGVEVVKTGLGERAVITSDDAVPKSVAGSKVSGTISDADGDPIDSATAELRQSGSVVKSASTNSSGGYSFSGVSDGGYTIRASAPGYQNSSTSITVAGSPVTGKDLTLRGSTLVKVRDQSGDPVSYATVQAVAWNNSSFTGTREEIQNEIDSLEDDISNPLPDSWTGRDYDIKSKRFEGESKRYIALHRPEDWRTDVRKVVWGVDAPLTAPGRDFDVASTMSNNPQLRHPKLAFQPDERIWVSCWNGGKSGFIQNDVDSDLPGASVNCNANITQLVGPDGISEPQTVQTTEVWSTFSGTDEYAGFIEAGALGPGVYEVEPASGDGISYTFVIAPDRDASSLRRNIVTDLENEKGNLVDRANQLEDLANNNKLEVKRVQTDKYGRARIAFNTTRVARVTALGYKQPATFDASEFPDLSVSGDRPTQADITKWYELKTDEFRENLESGNEEFAALSCQGISNATGSVAVPDGVSSDSVPAALTVDVRTVSRPDYLPPQDKLCAQADLVSFLEKQGLADQIPAFLQDVSDMSAEEIRQTYRNVSELISENPEACKEALRNQGLDSDLSSCTSGDDGGSKDSNDNGVPDPMEEAYEEETGREFPDSGDNISSAEADELREQLQDNRQAIEEVQDTIDSGEPTSSTGDDNETISLEFPFETDLSPGQVAVFVDYANGTTKTLGVESEYVEIVDSGATPVGGDTVRLVDYPLGSSDAAVANFRVNVATPEGTGSASESVRNPTYTGTIPQLSSLRVSSMTPGINETVQVGVNGKPGSGFGSTQAVRVTYPNGTTTTLPGSTDGQTNFTATDAGTHRVEAVFSPAGGGQNFTETLLVTARQTDVPRPPSIRPQSGPTGRYTVVSQAYEDGSIESDANGKRIDIRGNVQANADVPDTTHLYLSGLDRAPKSRITYRMTNGPDEQAVSQSSRVVMHLGTLSEDAIVYRGGAPLKVGGETPAGVVKQTNGSWTLSTYTGENGQVEVRVNNDPGWGDRAGYWVDLWLSTGSLPFLSLSFVNYNPATGALGWLVLLGVPGGSIVAVKRRWVDE